MCNNAIKTQSLENYWDLMNIKMTVTVRWWRLGT